MNYKIVITRKDPNPNFAVEVAKFEEKNRHGYMNSGMERERPQEDIVTDALICEITEEQFKKIKLEVLKAFE